MVDGAPTFIVPGIFWTITFFQVPFWMFKEREREIERAEGKEK